jgi:hypothetical protein
MYSRMDGTGVLAHDPVRFLHPPGSMPLIPIDQWFHSAAALWETFHLTLSIYQ